MSISLRNTVGNALSILTSEVMNRATSFVLYAMVARQLGAFEFGQLSLAFSLFYVFQVSAVAGLKILIVRDVAKDHSRTSLYFQNGCAIVTVSSFASFVLLALFVRLMHYSPATNLIVLMLSLGLFPYAIAAVCEGIFQAWERMRYIACVNVPANIGKIGAAYLLLSRNRGLYTVILILLASFFAVAAIEVWLILRRFPAQRASISIPFCLATVRSAITFLAIDKLIALESSLNVILLSKLASETDVGLYSAATQLLVPLALVYQSIAQSIFPVMCRKVEPGYQVLKRIAEQATELLLALALPTVTGIYFLGNWALTLLYKRPAFLEAVPALRIMVWILIFQVFTSVLGQVLLACHREKVTLRIIIVVLLATLVGGWPLISHYGLRGAAITMLLTRLIACIQHYIPVSRLLSGLPLSKIVWKPFVAASCMAAYLALARGQGNVLAGVSATLIYGAALLVLGLLACGGIREFKARLFYSWSGFPPARHEEVRS
jgi:O-antigen/teichoic acid export membrane protein